MSANDKNIQDGGTEAGAHGQPGLDLPPYYRKPFVIKVIILGESSVGKTCLMKRLVTKSFVDNTDVTYGGSHVSHFFKVGDEDVKMGIWDTAGSERFRSFISTYYRQATAAIVCYSLDDLATFKKVEYWIEAVRKHEQSCAMYICGTKVDLVTAKNPTEVTSEMVESLAIELKAAGFHETSSKTGQNVELLFQRIGEDFMKKVKQTENGKERETICLTENGETPTPEKKEGKFACC